MIALLILLVLLLLLFALSYAAFYVAVVRLPVKPNPALSQSLGAYAQAIEDGAAWFRAQEPQRVAIRSRDGLKLVGHFLPAEAEEARGTLLLVHGYRSSPWTDFGIIYPYFHSLGWNILTVHQRAHGESEGKYITFGIKERYDVCDWALYLSDRFGPQHSVVMDGISMGSTSVLMALGTELPENVRGAIADCGFTCPYDEFVHVLKARHIPRQPLLALAELHARAFAGFGFRDYSTVTALKMNRRPVLFVHGEKDSFVPIRFTVENYAACAAEKQLVTVPEAGHGASYLLETARCQAVLEDFLARV